MSRVVVMEPPSPDRRRREDLLRSAGHDVLLADDVEAAEAALAQADAAVVDDPRFADAARLAGCVPVFAVPGAGPDGLAEAVRRVLEDDDFDDASLQRMRDQFQAGFGGFVELFLRESRTRAESLQHGVAARDALLVGREAHTLKPTCGMLGARRLSLRCAEVEDACRGGWNDDLPGLCGDLLDDLARLRRRLEPMLHD